MKILINCLNLEKGGAERVISVLSNEFAKNNEVYILMLRKSDIYYEFDKKITILNVQNKPKSKIHKIISKISLMGLIKQKKQILKINPDIILSFLPEPSLKLMLIKRFDKRLKKIPTIVSVRNDPNVEYKNKLIFRCMKNLYKNLDGLVLQTDQAKDFFQNILSVPMEVIPNPIDEKFFNFPLKCSKREKSIVAVGRLEPQKNHKLLIDAFIGIKEKYNDYTLKIYGKGSLYNELKKYIELKGMEKKILLMGQVDNVANEIYNASIFVLSSDYEGMPNALMEALALGIPSISTDCSCGGPKQLVKDGINGYLIPTGDIKALERAISKLLDEEQIGEEFSKNSINMSKEFSIKNIASKWEKEIKKIIKE